MTDDDYVELGRQFGLFFRRAERFYQGIQCRLPGQPLDRAAYGVLARIAHGGPQRLSTLAGNLCADLSTVSRQVAALEAAGLVARRPDPTDGRASLIEATGTGLDVLLKHRVKWVGALKHVMADWTAGERHEFARLFARLNEAMSKTDAAPKANDMHRNDGMHENAPARAGMER